MYVLITYGDEDILIATLFMCCVFLKKYPFSIRNTVYQFMRINDEIT